MSLWFRYAIRYWLLPLALFLLLGGAVMAGIFFTLQKDELQFQREGVDTQATVLEKSRTKAKKGWNNKVVYEYADSEGNTHKAEDTIPDGPWAELKKGSRMPIQFLPSDPSKSRANYVANEDRVLLGKIGIGAGGGLAAIGLVTLLLSLRGISRQVRIVRTGTRTTATIKEFVQEFGVVAYEYTDANGQTHEYREQAPRGILGAKNPGEQFVVLYDSGNPVRHEIDKYGIRSEELSP